MSTTITVYGKPACGQCATTELALKRQGAEYAKRDVTQDEEALATITQLGYKQAPVVTITRGDKLIDHWSGFRPDKIAGYTIKEPQV